MPIQEAQLRRTAKSALRDPRSLPFLRDLLEIALIRSSPEDLICLSNDDVVFANGLTETLINVTCGWASRHEFVRLPDLPTCLEIVAARKHCGCDLFVFRSRWWLSHGSEMPDMILGAPEWDMVLRLLMQSNGGTELHAAIAHEEHRSYWLEHLNDPSTKHNRKLAGEWLKEKDLSWD